jgi:hypothetical protein
MELKEDLREWAGKLLKEYRELSDIYDPNLAHGYGDKQDQAKKLRIKVLAVMRALRTLDDTCNLLGSLENAYAVLTAHT